MMTKTKTCVSTIECCIKYRIQNCVFRALPNTLRWSLLTKIANFNHQSSLQNGLIGLPIKSQALKIPLSESVPLTVSCHLCFHCISSVWSILHHGSGWRVHSKGWYSKFTYTFVALFCLFFINKFVFSLFSFLFLIKCQISATEYQPIRNRLDYMVSPRRNKDEVSDICPAIDAFHHKSLICFMHVDNVVF